MTHPTTTLLYDALGPAITRQDPDGVLLAWLDGPGRLLGEVDDVVRDTDSGLGWAREFDPALANRPRWTAQLLGVTAPDGATDTQVRDLIVTRPSFRRGTVAAMVAAAQATLTGTKYVNVIERDGGAYRVRVQVFNEQTPDPAATEAAIRAQKPAGLVLTFQPIPMTSYLALEGETAQTHTALEAETAQTYTALEA